MHVLSNMAGKLGKLGREAARQLVRGAECSKLGGFSVGEVFVSMLEISCPAHQKAPDKRGAVAHTAFELQSGGGGSSSAKQKGFIEVMQLL